MGQNENSKMPSEAELRRQIVEIGRRLYDRRLVAAAAGNISARVSAGRILITPSGICKGKLSASDLIPVDPSGNALDARGRRPSSELGMHLCVYRQRPDVGAAVHAHPPYATACAVAGISLTEPVLPETVAALGPVVLAEYATPSTPEVAASISSLANHHDAIILKNHGVLTVGRDLEAAFMKMEMVEHLAQVVFLARKLGNVDLLTSAQVAALHQTFGRKNNSPPERSS